MIPIGNGRKSRESILGFEWFNITSFDFVVSCSKVCGQQYCTLYWSKTFKENAGESLLQWFKGDRMKTILEEYHLLADKKKGNSQKKIRNETITSNKCEKQLGIKTTMNWVSMNLSHC